MVIWWGAQLPADEDLEALADASAIDRVNGTLDEIPDLSICPEASGGFAGQPGLRLTDTTGAALAPRFAFSSDEASEGRLSLRYTDAALGLTYQADFALDAETGMLEARASLDTATPVRLHWLSAPVLPAPQFAGEMIDFSGCWVGEFRMQRTPWAPGARFIENRTGRTGHETFPGLILPSPATTNTSGEAMALHYGWSGGHQMLAEELVDGRRQVQFGHASGSETVPDTHFETTTLYAAWSDSGLNGCATTFQRHLRDKVVQWPNPDKPRPVHYNCWEAVYFDHDPSELKDIATRAAALGAERFVLDDGWFGRRDDDTSSLGDWWINPAKYPDGLTPLIEHVRGLGMEFGLWVEPEMVNPDSDLYRTHPDWALGAPDQVLGRNQMVLDMSRQEVRDYICDRIADLLDKNAISYLKWDHNRVLPAPDAAQARGTYALIDRLRAAFPDVEIESCSSGGGRIDAGILSRTHRVWLSDSNDALERLRMQHAAALFLPAAITGSHVGPRMSHTSGRVLDMSMRAWVAAQRHMGFEMDPRELTDDEAALLTRVTGWWKANRSWMMRADILRLDSADPAVTAEEQLARDGSRFVVFAGQVENSAQISPRPLRLTGLEAEAQYRITLLNRDEVPPVSHREMVLKTGPLTLSGRALMGQGITLPRSFPQRIWVIEGEKL